MGRQGARSWRNENEESHDNDDLYVYVNQNKKKTYAHQPALNTTQ